MALVLGAAMSSTRAHAQDSETPSGHARLLLHGTKTMETFKARYMTEPDGYRWTYADVGLGVHAWVIAPSLFERPSNWAGILGMRLDFFDDMNVELGLGVSIDGRDDVSRFSPVGKEFFLVDLRIGVGRNSRFGRHNRDWPRWLALWTNVQVIGPGSFLESWYWYAETDWVPKSWLSVGIESENLFASELDDTVSAGIHIKATYKWFQATVAYQRHLVRPEDASANQIWVRVATHFID